MMGSRGSLEADSTNPDESRLPSLSTPTAVAKLAAIVEDKLKELEHEPISFAALPSRERVLALVLVLASAAFLAAPVRLVIILSSVASYSIERLVHRRIDMLRAAEFTSRLRSAWTDLRSLKFYYSEVREPPSRAINLIRTHRDASWKLIPINLLVVGDVVQISPEDTPGVRCRPLSDEPRAARDLYVVTEAPLKRQLFFLRPLKAAGHGSWGREAELLSKQVHVLVIVALLARPLVCNVHQEFVLSMMFVLLTLSPLWGLIFFCYGNARVIALAEILQKSKTPYTENEDVDEFDEDAPPPTKDIYIHPGEILRKIWEALVPSTFVAGGGSAIFWSYELVDNFARVSVLCYLDREGLIANSFPMPVEIAFPHPMAEGELTFGEFIGDPNNSTLVRTSYADASVCDEDLKAVGLSLLVSSSCGIHGGGHFRREWHSRFAWNAHPGRKLDPVFRTCTCSIARDLGFRTSAAVQYSRVSDFWIVRDIGISTLLSPVEYQGLFSRIFMYKENKTLHMFSFGDLTTAACLSRFTWNARRIEPLSEVLRRKLIELDDNLAASDLQCIGLTYKPILSNSPPPVLGGLALDMIDFRDILDGRCSKEVSRLASNHIFLGALISGYNPKEDMQELIDDLENGGVRFVYFSPYSESVTKAFGDRLGLETDWNSCIILSKHPMRSGQLLDTSQVSEFTDSKSKLPRGVHNIRPHLENVDDIPLHISLFAECEPSCMTEMLAIYDEYDEYVVAVGSSLNWANAEVFSRARCPVAMEPPNLRTSSVGNGKVGSMQLGATLTSLACPIVLPFDSSPYVFTEVIREARSLFRGTHSSLVFRLVSAVALTVVSFFVPLSTFSILLASVLTWITSFAYLFAPYEPDILKLMPRRFWLDNLKTQQVLFYSSQAAAFSSVLLLALWLSDPRMSSLLVCLSYIALGITSLHDYLPPWQFGPREHWAWSVTMLVVLLLVACVRLYTLASDVNARSIVAAICLAIVASLLIASLVEYAKAFWRQLVRNGEKRARLLFNTKLGMHSPV